jgi:NADH-quinone oxidoreductase E subunit
VTPRNEVLIKKIDAAIAEYPHPQSALLAVLHLIQQERGYLSEDDHVWVAEKFSLPVAQVAGVVTFYTMFRRQPPGRHHLQVCKTLSCRLRGCEEILEHLDKKHGIREGEVTPDGRFSLVRVECLGSCGTAPMMQVNDDFHENLTRERVDALLDEMK